MAFLIGGANSAADTAFSVANSCRFNDGDSPSMSKTQGTATNVKIFTVSMWAKRCTNGADQHLWETYLTSGAANDRVTIQFMDSNAFRIKAVDGGSTVLQKETTRLFRDPSAWYHLCVAVDTTQAVAANRCKIYVNGTQETSFSTDTIWDQNVTPEQGTSSYTNIISKYGGGSNYFDGYLAEVVFIDGSQLAASSFGEFDEDTPTVFKPIDVSGLTFGTNGFYLDFEASDNLGNDKNGGTDLTESNLAATDQSSDSPTNNWCVLNGVFGVTNQDLAEGNLKVTNSTTTWNFRPATIGVTAGKWYAEYKITTTNYHMHGVVDLQYAVAQGVNSYTHLGAGTGSVGYYIDGEKYIAGTNSSYGNSYGDGEILGIALDMDNAKVYFAIDNTWQDSGDPTSGATGTGAISLPTTGTYTFAESVRSGGSVEVNFGNPPYANSSDAADGNGYGAFEFAPPSSYLALCTKNLGSTGG